MKLKKLDHSTIFYFHLQVHIKTMALECLWDVKSLEDFLYYCCPECNERKQSREGFLTHALNQHPESNDFLVHYHHIKVELEESILVKKNDANEEASMIDEKYEPVVKIKEEEDDCCEEILNVDYDDSITINDNNNEYKSDEVYYTITAVNNQLNKESK